MTDGQKSLWIGLLQIAGGAIGTFIIADQVVKPGQKKASRGIEMLKNERANKGK